VTARRMHRHSSAHGSVNEMEILLKRAYEKSTRGDGFRVLVDRLWPRGVRKVDLRAKVWAKEIAPSTALRQWFGHDPRRWPEFRKRYKRELRSPAARRAIAQIIHVAKRSPTITLLYGAKDTEHNEAVVLQGVFKRVARAESRKPPQNRISVRERSRYVLSSTR
jgi:uncharacterized protein YeaO (DUF488 family)